MNFELNSALDFIFRKKLITSNRVLICMIETGVRREWQMGQISKVSCFLEPCDQKLEKSQNFVLVANYYLFMFITFSERRFLNKLNCRETDSKIKKPFSLDPRKPKTSTSCTTVRFTFNVTPFSLTVSTRKIRRETRVRLKRISNSSVFDFVASKDARLAASLRTLGCNVRLSRVELTAIVCTRMAARSFGQHYS